jgi:hypothetical protein
MGKHQPALLGGLFIGVISSLPIVSALNLCCCLWVVLGGLLVVYLQQQRTPEPVETADAILGGLIAGLIGAVITSAISMMIARVTGPLFMEQVRSQLESNPDVPPEARDFILNLITGRGLIFMLFAVNLPLYAVFSMLGSLLGLAVFRKKAPPQVQG